MNNPLVENSGSIVSLRLWISRLLLALAVLGLGLAESVRAELELAKSAPPLRLRKLLQAPPDAGVSWTALTGKVVVVDFWATWCGPCRQTIPHWNELVESFKGKPVQFLAVTDESEEVVSAFLRSKPISSWVGLDGLGPSTTESYGIEGLPTTVIINQVGLLVAVTHPAQLLAKHIQEVLDQGKSSLPQPKPNDAMDLEVPGSERVSRIKPVFEVSVQPAGPLPEGHGFDVWEGSGTSADATGQYCTVKRAIVNLFDSKELLLDCQVPLPTQLYDFKVQLPPNARRGDRYAAVLPLFRSVFGLEIRRVSREQEVYVIRAISTNAPGLVPSTASSRGGGGEEAGGVKLGRAPIGWLTSYFEQFLKRPVLDETGLTDRFDIRFRWKMSRRELLPLNLGLEVFRALVRPDRAEEDSLSAEQRRLVAAYRGELPAAEARSLSAEVLEDLRLLRLELAKPEDERFMPETQTILVAAREQLGLDLRIERRTVQVIVVEDAK